MIDWRKMVESQQENESRLESFLTQETLREVDLRAQQTINWLSEDFARINSLKDYLLIRNSISVESILNQIHEKINSNCVSCVFYRANKIAPNAFLGKAVYLEKVLNGLNELREKYWAGDDFTRNILDKQITHMKDYLNMVDVKNSVSND